VDGIESAFNALLNYSPMSLILGVVIALLSMIDVFLAKKTWKQRGLKILVVVLSVTLLFVQARSSKKAQVKKLKDCRRVSINGGIS
jgi:hypothetical protein